MLLRVLYPYKNINIYIIIDAKQIQELLSPWRKETQQSLRVFVASFPIRFFFLLLSLFIYIFQSSLAEECWKSARAAYAKRFAARSIQNFVSFNDEEKAFRCYRQTSSNLNANEAPLNSPRFNRLLRRNTARPTSFGSATQLLRRWTPSFLSARVMRPRKHKASIDLCIEREEEDKKKVKSFIL